MVEELAARVVALSTSYHAMHMPRPAFEGICQLSRLTSLVLQRMRADPDQQQSLHALSQLTGLEELRLDVSPSGASQVLLVPPQLSRLRALHDLALSGFACSSSIFGSPRLKHLYLVQGRYVDLDDGLRHLCMPDDLPQLAALCLHGIVLSSSPAGLESLTSLTRLSFDCSTLGANISMAHLGSALSCLTGLRDLQLPSSSEGIDCEMLSALASLTNLIMEDLGLRSMHCSNRWCSLEKLNLQGNMLACMPENLTALSSLIELDLRNQMVDFQITRPLLPICRALPSLRRMCLLQQGEQLQHHWNGMSMIHLVEAAEYAEQMFKRSRKVFVFF